MPVLIQFFVISICFLITANVDDADGFFLETNSDTGKNNHKLIRASIGNQAM